jgi:septal ring factor EnvC (AmiA/AmiB activator)
VVALARALHEQRDENVALRRKLEERSRHARVLEGQLLEANQLRKDVAKRIDELVSQLDHLDGQLAAAES